jgi:TRAP transporter 4TM/12TM fusion protein
MFGSISGSAVSNVATTGVITIPLMKGAGYKAEQAGAIEAVASTGGQLMPPIMGAAAFLMAEWLDIPYKDVMLAALLPAILYYLALFVLADLEAARSNIKPIARSEIPAAWPVVKSGWMFPIPFVVLIGALFWLNYSPEWAALLAALSILVLGTIFGYRGKRLNFNDFYQAIRTTGLAVLDIFMIGAGAGIIIGVLGLSGLGFGLSLLLVQLGEGNVVILLVVSAGICILLGMGMPTAGVYLLLAPLVAPSLIEVGFGEIASHLFILYFGMMSMITPPVAIAAFAAASLAGAEAMRTGFAAVKFGWFAYLVPFLFIGSPALLMVGSPGTILLVAVSAAIGVWLVCIAVMGFFLRALNPFERLVYAAVGLVLLVPVDKVVAGLSNEVAELFGLAVGVLLIGREIMLRRRAVAR